MGHVARGLRRLALAPRAPHVCGCADMATEALRAPQASLALTCPPQAGPRRLSVAPQRRHSCPRLAAATVLAPLLARSRVPYLWPMAVPRIQVTFVAMGLSPRTRRPLDCCLRQARP